MATFLGFFIRKHSITRRRETQPPVRCGRCRRSAGLTPLSGAVIFRSPGFPSAMAIAMSNTAFFGSGSGELDRDPIT